MHIAMWSGPRNLSTALMYSFAARSDFDVVDEPFYGSYLKITGADHPLREETLASMECDSAIVAASLSAARERHFYSKQMTHHMVPGVSRDWFASARHVFLIRHPNRVIGSYLQKRENPTFEDIGFGQQTEIFEFISDLGRDPLVIDSSDIRRDPRAILSRLCDELQISWSPEMLTWPAGGHSADGAWAPHWYGAVHRSTGFAGPEGPLPELDTTGTALAALAMPHYEKLKQFAITD